MEELIKRFHPKLRDRIYYHTRDKDSLDDLTQEAWYGIITSLDSVSLQISFDVWAYSIARRKAIDWIRKNQRQRNKAEQLQHEQKTNQYEVTDAVPDELIESIHIHIQKLPASQQIVLKMFYLENLSIKEISQTLAISDGTVKSRLYNARKNLKKVLTV